MTRWWVSWWFPRNQTPVDSGVFSWAISGVTLDENPMESYCALFEASPDGEEKIWALIDSVFPDCEHRFAHDKGPGWTPHGDRFGSLTPCMVVL